MYWGHWIHVMIIDNSHFYLTPSTEGVESTRGNSVCQSICPSSLFPSPNIVFLFLPCSSSPQLTKYFFFSKYFPPFPSSWQVVEFDQVYLPFFLRFICVVKILYYIKISYYMIMLDWAEYQLLCWTLKNALKATSGASCTLSTLRPHTCRHVEFETDTIHVLPACFLRLTIYCSLMLMIEFDCEIQ